MGPQGRGPPPQAPVDGAGEGVFRQSHVPPQQRRRRLRHAARVVAVEGVPKLAAEGHRPRQRQGQLPPQAVGGREHRPELLNPDPPPGFHLVDLAGFWSLPGLFRMSGLGAGDDESGQRQQAPQERGAQEPAHPADPEGMSVEGRMGGERTGIEPAASGARHGESFPVVGGWDGS